MFKLINLSLWGAQRSKSAHVNLEVSILRGQFIQDRGVVSMDAGLTLTDVQRLQSQLAAA
jgi:hypothetical protein